MHRIADGIEALAEEIAICECCDTGQAWRFRSKAALRGAENFRFLADLAPGAGEGKSLPTPDHLNLTSRTVDRDHEPIRCDLKGPQRQTLWGTPAPRSIAAEALLSAEANHQQNGLLSLADPGMTLDGAMPCRANLLR